MSDKSYSYFVLNLSLWPRKPEAESHKKSGPRRPYRGLKWVMARRVNPISVRGHLLFRSSREGEKCGWLWELKYHVAVYTIYWVCTRKVRSNFISLRLERWLRAWIVTRRECLGENVIFIINFWFSTILPTLVLLCASRSHNSKAYTKR